MYTCCPICKTNFTVTEAQLQVAQGKVRCGSCKNVFNARQHIHYRASKAEQTSPNETLPKTPAYKTPQPTATTHTKKPATSADAKNLFLKKESIENKKTIPETKPVSEIDAIFNALDTQLSSGTYIDIATTEKKDIREAEFSDIFDGDELSDASIPAPIDRTNNDRHESLENDINLSLYAADNKEISNTDIEKNAVHTQIPEDKDLNETLETTSTEKGKQQHTFDFINLPDEPNVTADAKEQLAAVNTPLKMSPTNKLVTKTENDELHKAIDNIIKVDNTITTPFEENDADHFVIEMQTEPDVELVDEGDIDRLFASTDSLKMSDLKFGTNKSFDSEKDFSTSNNVASEVLNEDAPDSIFSAPVNALNTQIDKENDTLAATTYSRTEQSSGLTYDLDEEQNFDTESSAEMFANEKQELEAFEKSLEANNFDDNSEKEEFDPDEILEDDEIVKSEELLETNEQLETEFDDDDIDEEIVLSSIDLNNDVPHRLRDAVAHLEQPKASLQKRLLYASLIMVFTLLAIFQLVLYKSTALANSLPVLQPALVSLCQTLPCRYTGNHNRKQIKILSRDVRLHPKIKGALLISATIVNKAGHTQPYPTILLRFTDLTGATVAQRYFQPTEYLGLLNKPFALMPTEKPVQLNIELLDPGSDAINFQFSFH